MAKRRRGTHQGNYRETGPVPGKYPGVEAGGEAPAHKFFWFLSPALIVSGYISLHKAAAGGQNPWAIAAPVLLLSGYFLIIPAIIRSARAK